MPALPNRSRAKKAVQAICRGRPPSIPFIPQSFRSRLMPFLAGWRNFCLSTKRSDDYLPPEGDRSDECKAMSDE